ncbi:MAG: 50S ribosomal protein L17 [Deltaproteobacteria bacterium CG12_big_fil_rev_8_21_14_0_65_43_10]|nr:MAG: 50S ribosomal protein L17 [Deltaproteobacteria bacterium CG2_30_43_15]PIQ45767.1 MAG: 50S ribosomal protein L17 [Deltaproteobacteria bacterium CG12_big_fil_rev_8_21_14_0_65_43_10]PIU84371.1 MAG: 50S ribosomal protein L17 [Deltaproteobacteria bacterium CG06_land_8_20_14_3_00_44_19]PIX22152.1 MAG: 50S ribosomal protein L17 [Deltaproteobacteria bacterium CG_4_8_14_3_um_filter_43_13]PIZ19760.1 MAG: 50S ribosomal protein L17 [Deltaproteobacteria bacterium CG_4_10_14_0_8_um_filter_43_12]PJB4
MRHQKAGRKLGRTSSHRKAMFRNMLTSLFEHEKIETTDAKAKELRKIAEKIVTLGEKGDLHSRRQVLRVISDKKIAKNLFDQIAPRYQSRNGGYTRIFKVGRRHGDNAPLSLIELIPEENVQKPKKRASGQQKKREAVSTAPK